MERLTEHSKEDFDNIIYSGNDEIAVVKKLAEYEDAEGKLQKHFGANITLIDMLNHFVLYLEDKDGTALKGFRVLTNEDAESYDAWKLDNGVFKEQLDISRAEVQGLSKKLVECQKSDADKERYTIELYSRARKAEEKADYWEREAKKWCAKLGEIRLWIGGQN